MLKLKALGSSSVMPGNSCCSEGNGRFLVPRVTVRLLGVSSSGLHGKARHSLLFVLCPGGG